MTDKKIRSIIEQQETYKNIMRKKSLHTKKSIKRAIHAFCDLGGFQMQEIVKVRMYSRDRLTFAGIDLLHLQNAILSLPDRALEAVSQYGYDEPYDKNALEYALVILAEKLKLTVNY